ncbi:hypothetical protein DFH29DRAFT_956147 [Suillus ampliporus]|nr:hypothetical protein DFH29DRAFT_956147 [Suillus ampliporus]
MYNKQREERHDGRRDGMHDRREALEERLHGRHEERNERRYERHEDHNQQRRHDQDQPHYAPSSGPPPGDYARADFVSDADFKRMMHGGAFSETPRVDHIGPEDFGEWDRSRPPPNASYQPSYQGDQSHQHYPEPPLPPIPHEQRTSGYESGAYSQPSHDKYSIPESLELRHGSSAYASSAGAQSSHAPAGGYSAPPGPPSQGRSSYGSSAYAPPVGAPGTHAPAGGYSTPPGPPPQARPSHGYNASPQGGSGRGAASDYYDGPPPGQSTQSPSYTPDNAASYGNSSNPARYHEAADGLHGSYQTQQYHPSDEFDEEKYKSHFSAHAQAYGSGFDDRMANDDIGAAAAIEALKIAAANNQSGARPQQGAATDAPHARPSSGLSSFGAQYSQDAPHARPPAGLSSGAQHSPDVGGRPSGGKPQGRPQNAESGSECESEDEGPSPKPQAPTGGGGVQDKIVGFFAIFAVDVLNPADCPGDGPGRKAFRQEGWGGQSRKVASYANSCDDCNTPDGGVQNDGQSGHATRGDTETHGGCDVAILSEKVMLVHWNLYSMLQFVCSHQKILRMVKMQF